MIHLYSAWILPSCTVVTLPEISALRDWNWVVHILKCSLWKGMDLSSPICFFQSYWGENTHSNGQEVLCWKGRGGHGVSLGSDKPAWGKCSEGLRWGLIYPLHWDTFERKRDAADTFAESTAVIRDCLGQTGPCGYPNWGQCERAQDIEGGFTKCGEDAKEHRSSFKNVQGKWGELISSSECSFLCALWFCWSKKWDVVQKAGGFSIRPAFFYFLLSVWLLGMSFP